MVRRKAGLRGIALGAALAVAVIGILTFYVWYQTESLKLAIDISRSDARVRELEADIEALKLRRAELLNPGRVEKIARESLGLVDPKNEDISFDRMDAPR